MRIISCCQREVAVADVHLLFHIKPSPRPAFPLLTVGLAEKWRVVTSLWDEKAEETERDDTNHLHAMGGQVTTEHLSGLRIWYREREMDRKKNVA